MNIIGNRIYLRAVELSDKEMLLDIINDEQTESELGGWSFPVSDLNQEEWIKSLKQDNKTLRCVIVNKEDDKAIGTVILSDIDYKNGIAEIHIKIGMQIRSKGYGTETINLIVGYAFNELRLNCIYAHINSYNEKSQKLFEKCGFVKEGILRDRIFKKGDYHNIYSYSLLKGDFNGDR
ncbi:MAG: GNAT family N-acetyltransferase [Candidatus Paracaedibacteraceae bacterium]|nr:GNAT family N-acetyltransferase [Candidatus Paracaedibacteraceae bacterium]